MKRNAARLTRLITVVVALWLIHQAPTGGGSAPPSITLEQVRLVHPQAERLRVDPTTRGSFVAHDADGRVLGFVLRTSPDADDLIGYTGPNDVLIGLDPDRRVVAVRMLQSADTPAHVGAVTSAASFWRQFHGWDPALDRSLEVDAVAGSTLTSLAIAESIDLRLRGEVRSRRFPRSVELGDVTAWFEPAVSLRGPERDGGWIDVLDERGHVLGSVVRTSPQADNVRGYRGPTDVLIAVDEERRSISGVRLLHSYDTPEYVELVREDRAYRSQLSHPSVEEWATLDFERAAIEGVSGATQTSYAVAEGVRRKLATLAAAETPDRRRTRALALAVIIAGGVALSLRRWRSRRRVRRAWQLVTIVGLGLVLGDLVSLALISGWARHGVPWRVAPAMVALIAVALAVPWLTGRQPYCHNLCPHGAAQEWLGSIRRFRVRVPRELQRQLRRVPAALLVVSFAVALFAPAWNLTALEPFDAWVFGIGALASAGVAIVGLVASVFVPMAYCRFGCPTGALLSFVRSRGASDRLRRRDGVALVLVALACVPTFAAWGSGSSGRHAPDLPSALSGAAFGTSWTVRVRGTLPSALGPRITAEIDRVEGEFSSWRESSEVSQLNDSQTDLPLEVSAELVDLIVLARDVSRSTGGAFDLTVGPLVDAWGAGPSRRASTPTGAELAELLERTGWERIEIDRGERTLRKRHPSLRIDLGSLLQGYAVDRVAALLDESGVEEYLVEVGGELRARGRWQVAIESPKGGPPLRVFVLEDGALAVSGSYRNDRHLISPLTGRPVEVAWTLVAVRASTALVADLWATALFVSGAEAEPIARTHGLPALLVDPDGRTVELPAGSFR